MWTLFYILYFFVCVTTIAGYLFFEKEIKDYHKNKEREHNEGIDQ